MPVIKVSDEEYQRILDARKQLAMQGFNSLPDMTKKELSDAEKFTLGAIVGLGTMLLLKELSKK